RRHLLRLPVAGRGPQPHGRAEDVATSSSPARCASRDDRSSPGAAGRLPPGATDGPLPRVAPQGASGRVVILDRGNVELVVPEGWAVTAESEGHLDIRDPTDSCKLEVSYLRLPPLKPEVVPPVSDFLREALAKEHGEPPI